MSNMYKYIGTGIGLASMIALGYIHKKYFKKEINNGEFICSKEYIAGLTQSDIPDIIKAYSESFENCQILSSAVPKKLLYDGQVELFSQQVIHSKDDAIDINSLNESLFIPAWDLLDRGGKRIRPVLCFILSEVFGQPWKNVQEIAATVEAIHNATLLVDDIEDSSEFRRGKPCVHKIFGSDIAINAGNFLYFGPFYRLLQNKKYANNEKLKSQFIQVYLEEMINLHLGQAWDIYWHSTRNKGVPTKKQYLDMVSNKTGVLLRIAAKWTGLALGLGKDLINLLSTFAEYVGISFQIQDDILNLAQSEYIKGKGYVGEDIHEGKMSYIVIDCLENSTLEDKARLLEILKMKTEDQTLITEAIALINKTNSIERSREYAENIVIIAIQRLSKALHKNPNKKLLEYFAKFCIERKN